MLSRGDEIDLEDAHASSAAQRFGRVGRKTQSNRLSLLKVVRESALWCNRQEHQQIVNGRTRSFSRTLASSAHDGRSGWRCGGVSPALERLTSHLRAYYRHRFARIGHGPAEAKDLLQEALIAIHTHRHTYDPSQPFTPWIHAIARCKFLDYRRRMKSSFKDKDIPMESAQDLTATSEVAAVESGLDVERLMSKISSKARQAIQFVKVEGLSVSEAAARCGMSEAAVKVAVHRGLKALPLRIRQERGT
jgi:RNA polymerase sigma-70 factor, ECF subfamily